MLVHQGPERTDAANKRLAWSLAGVAGCVNAAGFYAAGLYSSHMTGTLSTLADHLALGDGGAALVGVGVVACFIAGAISSTVLINRGQRRGAASVYVLSILLEALLLAGLGAVDLWLPQGWRGPTLIFGLSFLMGLQNATVTRISDARVRTTHVTGMITDIGIELGHLIDIARHGGGDGGAGRADTAKLKLHVPTVLFFLLGGVLGVLGYRWMGPLLLPLVALVLLAVALRGLVDARRMAGAPPSSPVVLRQ